MIDCIDTTGLFPVLNARLMEALSGLGDEDFLRPTNFPSWKVKDICAHLLDTSIRRLSGDRDGYASPNLPRIASYGDLIRHVTTLADRWASAFEGVSPRILVEMVGKYQDELYEYLRGLPPLGEAHFPVSWAGEEKSLNRFDIAREYTERWHHQMQIREALGEAPLYADDLYFPVIDTFMKALPHHYRGFEMRRGYLLCVEIGGEAGWKWRLRWGDGPELETSAAGSPDTVVSLRKEDAWKIFTRWEGGDIYNAVVSGDQALGRHILGMKCLLIQ